MPPTVRSSAERVVSGSRFASGSNGVPSSVKTSRTLSGCRESSTRSDQAVAPE